MGLTVIPPGHLKIWNADGCPNIDVVNVRFDIWKNSSIRDDFSTVKDTGLIGESIGSESTPKTTSVELGVIVDWRIDRMATC